MMRPGSDEEVAETNESEDRGNLIKSQIGKLRAQIEKLRVGSNIDSLISEWIQENGAIDSEEEEEFEAR